jgi:L-alanine-DL-glutamate epimerase-like enolase superfamily enzyme
VKIASLEAREYRFPFQPPFRAAWDPSPRTSLAETIVMVQTDEGLTGFGGGAPVPDLALLDRYLAGVDPSDPERILSVCETVDFHGGRNWTVEVAVWDLLARAAGLPLWRFLGGARDRMPAYASTGEVLDSDSRVERLIAWRDQGWKAAKIRFHRPDWKQDLAVVAAARSALGEGMVIMVDANQGWRMPGDLSPSWKLDTARSCAEALGELGVYWLEEPLPTWDLEGYAALRQVSPVRLAAGEMVRSLAESRRLAGVVDVIQNDVILAGGVAGCRRVAGWAAAAGSVWNPHTWTTGLGLLANLHLALAISTGEFIEVPYDPPGWPESVRDFMLPAPLLTRDGLLAAPAGPGLGFEPDLVELERWRVG